MCSQDGNADDTPEYDREEIAFLGASTLPGVGMKTLRRIGGRDGIRLMLEAKDPRSIGLPTDLPWKDFRVGVWAEGKKLARELVKRSTTLVFEGDEAYPRTLLDIPPEQRPSWLFMRGNRAALGTPSIAVVGTRNPSPEGIFIAQYAVTTARVLNAVVLSGLAKGIDAAAHEWALRRGSPTVSVLGTGILRSYPANHKDLGEQIVDSGGLLISEYLPNDGPLKERFVERNRLQAALSRAVLAAEWTKGSGTAHTVRYARQLKRPVYGIRLPGQKTANNAGVTDREFVIPREETELLRTLRRDLSRPVESQRPEVTQVSIFDRGGRCSGFS